MPVPMVVCALCKRDVSKRSTLSLDVLGAGGGRACRSHEQVAQLAEQLAENAKLKRQWNAAERNLRVINAVAAIQMMVTLMGISEEGIYHRFRMAGYEESLIAEIRAEVARQGGPVISIAEVGAAFLAGMMLSRE